MTSFDEKPFITIHWFCARYRINVNHISISIIHIAYKWLEYFRPPTLNDESVPKFYSNSHYRQFCSQLFVPLNWRKKKTRSRRKWRNNNNCLINPKTEKINERGRIRVSLPSTKYNAFSIMPKTILNSFHRIPLASPPPRPSPPIDDNKNTIFCIRISTFVIFLRSSSRRKGSLFLFRSALLRLADEGEGVKS